MLNLKDIYPIGIDITDQHVYAAQFHDTSQGTEVGHLLAQKREPGPAGDHQPGDGLLPVLKTIAKTRRFKGRMANIHLPEKHLNCFNITFDLKPDQMLEEGIAGECRQALSFPLEEAVVDYVSLMESKDKKRRYKATVVAVRKEIVDSYLSLIRRAGLSVGIMDLHLSSLLRIHRYLFKLENSPVILCNVDTQKSLLSVVTKNRILAQRHFAWGVQPILNRLVSSFELDDENDQAVRMLTRYGLVHEKLTKATGRPPGPMSDQSNSDMAIARTLFQLLTPYIEELIQEFYQITGYVRAEIPTVRFKEVVLYGWASAINYLDQYVENRLNIPTKAINPLDKLMGPVETPSLESTDGTPFAPALGLALRKVSWL